MLSPYPHTMFKGANKYLPPPPSPWFNSHRNESICMDIWSNCVRYYISDLVTPNLSRIGLQLQCCIPSTSRYNHCCKFTDTIFQSANAACWWRGLQLRWTCRVRLAKCRAGAAYFGRRHECQNLLSISDSQTHTTFLYIGPLVLIKRQTLTRTRPETRLSHRFLIRINHFFPPDEDCLPSLDSARCFFF